MAKYKNKKVVPSTHSNGRRSWEQTSSKQSIMAARAFKPFDFLARREGIDEIVVEVNKEAQIMQESKLELVEIAQKILGGNVIGKKSGRDAEDVAWVQAAWAHPEGQGLLDPVGTFEVGVAVSRNPRPLEECERAAKFLRFEEALPMGLGMIPNDKGEHLNVPMLGIILRPNTVEVRRGGHYLGTTSIWSALIGFEERTKVELQKESPREALEAEAIRRELRTKKKEAAREQRRLRKLEEEKAEMEDCFTSVWEEWEAKEAERIAEEKQAVWADFIRGNRSLQTAWAACRKASQVAFEERRELAEAIQLVLRPEKPKAKDLKESLPLVRDHILSLDDSKERWGELMEFSKARKHIGLDVGKALAMAHREMPWLLPEVFVEDGEVVTVLDPLKQIAEYTRSEFIDRVAQDPLIEDGMKETLFLLVGEE